MFELISLSTIHEKIQWKTLNYIVTKGLIQQNSLGYGVNNIKQRQNFIKFILKKNQLLKSLKFFLPHKKSNLHIGGIWFVSAVPLPCSNDLPCGSIHNCDCLHMLQLFFQIFGQGSGSGMW